MPPKFNFTKDETVNADAFAAAGGGRFCIKIIFVKTPSEKTVRFTPPKAEAKLNALNA